MNPSPTKISFDRDYYENGVRCGLSLYTDYRWLPELTIPMAEALVRNLGIKKEDTILDFGCAKGYVVKALRGLGYQAFGCDISQYAIDSAPEEIRSYVSTLNLTLWPIGFDWTLAKDVLEHVEEADLPGLLRDIRGSSKNLFIAVPLGQDDHYVIADMDKDVTHKIRQPLWWWAGAVEEAGFRVVSATFSMPGIKENWTRRFAFGNGFIVAR